MKTLGAAALAVWFCTALFAAEKTLDIYFIDVEAGNATLIVSPSGQSMLIDGGTPNQAGRSIAVIKQAGLKQIDYEMVTHFHMDHFGAVAAISKQVPIANWVDHGAAVEAYKSEEWKQQHVLRFSDEAYDSYLKARESGKHIVVAAGDKIPIRGIETTVVAAGGQRIAKPMPGGGAANPWCESTPLRKDAENEDSQSVGTLIAYGKFRFLQLGDLTWNNARAVACPVNLVGPVDVFTTTHHAMSVDKENGGEVISGYSACSKAEVWGLAPRVAILNAGSRWHRSDYFHWFGGPAGWETVHNSPGLEDFWQMHYQPEGGTKYNVAEQYIANLTAENCPGHWLKLAASSDGSFRITNSRTGVTKQYQARRKQAER
jgi:beta-lactamase superfamily II metal-dependent hydrolase